MMCHGPLDSLFRAVEEALGDNRGHRYDRPYDHSSPAVERSVDVELARMYARGEVSRDTFLRLRPLAQRGELTWVDLDNLRREGRPVTKAVPADENAVALASIREKKAALEQARGESEAVSQSLQQRIAGLTGEAAHLEEQAREALPKSEDQARNLLTKRQELLERSRELQERAHALRQDVQKLDDLRVELDVRKQELKVLRARERLSALEEEIKREGPSRVAQDPGDPRSRQR